MDNAIRILSENVSLIASKKTWIEGLAVEQLMTTAKLPHMVKVVGMPDLHPGKGYPVGAVCFTTGHIYPALIGNDIGCGMALWQLDIKVAKLKLDKVERSIGDIDHPTGGEKYNLGTLGGGNHFAELQKVDQIYDQQLFDEYRLSEREIFLLVHTGSRGFGEAILQQHLVDFGHRGVADSSHAAQRYLQQHNDALEFATLNRESVASRICNNLHCQGNPILNVHHNFLQPVTLQGQTGWLHRKGASPATNGLVVIPGSRGDYSYLVKPIGNEALLLSLAHGAGRKWGRSECRGRLENGYTIDDLQRSRLGSRVICRDRELIYEEAPQAYKPIDSVIESMEQALIVQRVARLTPLLTYKTQGTEL